MKAKDQEGIISKARQPEAGNYYIEAGFKAGIQEVVDWVERNTILRLTNKEWQDQLKEWGITP